MALWSEAEDAALAANYPEHGANWDGWDEVLPNRTRSAISARAVGRGIRMTPEAFRRRAQERQAEADGWAAGEIVALATYYPFYGPMWRGWGEVLPNRTRDARADKARALGIRSAPCARFTDEDRQAILSAVMAVAIALRARPRDVAAEVVRLGFKYEEEGER